MTTVSIHSIYIYSFIHLVLVDLVSSRNFSVILWVRPFLISCWFECIFFKFVCWDLGVLDQGVGFFSDFFPFFLFTQNMPQLDTPNCEHFFV